MSEASTNALALFAAGLPVVAILTVISAWLLAIVSNPSACTLILAWICASLPVGVLVGNSTFTGDPPH